MGPKAVKYFNQAGLRFDVVMGNNGVFKNNSRLNLLFFVLLFSISAANLHADENSWSCNGPSGGTVLTIAVHPIDEQIIYIGTVQNGIYKTTDGGENWSALDTNLAGVYVHCLALDPVTPTIIYATTDTGVFVLGR